MDAEAWLAKTTARSIVQSMHSVRRHHLKSLLPLFLIVAIAVVQAGTRRGTTTLPVCAGSASCSGDLSQPLLELLQPR